MNPKGLKIDFGNFYFLGTLHGNAFYWVRDCNGNPHVRPPCISRLPPGGWNGKPGPRWMRSVFFLPYGTVDAYRNRSGATPKRKTCLLYFKGAKTCLKVFCESVFSSALVYHLAALKLIACYLNFGIGSLLLPISPCRWA
jgi:hypothetical protein